MWFPKSTRSCTLIIVQVILSILSYSLLVEIVYFIIVLTEFVPEWLTIETVKEISYIRCLSPLDISEVYLIIDSTYLYFILNTISLLFS
jgi:hypothetical protein